MSSHPSSPVVFINSRKQEWGLSFSFKDEETEWNAACSPVGVARQWLCCVMLASPKLNTYHLTLSSVPLHLLS